VLEYMYGQNLKLVTTNNGTSAPGSYKPGMGSVQKKERSHKPSYIVVLQISKARP